MNNPDNNRTREIVLPGRTARPLLNVEDDDDEFYTETASPPPVPTSKTTPATQPALSLEVDNEEDDIDSSNDNDEDDGNAMEETSRNSSKKQFLVDFPKFMDGKNDGSPVKKTKRKAQATAAGGTAQKKKKPKHNKDGLIPKPCGRARAGCR